MSIVDDYLATLSGGKQRLVRHMYEVVRYLVPTATEEFSYGMPAFKHQGKGLVAVMANKQFLSLYPFCALERLELNLSEFDCTSGSIHFSPDKPISDDLLRQIIAARKRLIEG
jgi:uncharacterized protein YdhG (YjbR/CyaY superfamily)